MHSNNLHKRIFQQDNHKNTLNEVKKEIEIGKEIETLSLRSSFINNRTKEISIIKPIKIQIKLESPIKAVFMIKSLFNIKNIQGIKSFKRNLIRNFPVMNIEVVKGPLMQVIKRESRNTKGQNFVVNSKETNLDRDKIKMIDFLDTTRT